MSRSIWFAASDLDAYPEERERQEECGYCDEDGWQEGQPIPTPDGPHFPVARCTACGGVHHFAVELRPLEQDDLPIMCGDEQR